MNTEFKEKTYEKYFSSEIARLTNVTFSPDQCDEAYLGFDDAFLLPLSRLMHLAPFVRRSRWPRMSGISIRDFDHIADELSRRMPPFRLNLFVQYKRPVYLMTRGANEWTYWKCPYYRYETTPHQQELLDKIEIQSQGRAATVYASPAFWKSDDLWAHVETEGVIENSNVANVARLSGHGLYSYISPGFQGKGHSETKNVESTPLISLIARGLEVGEALPLNQHLKRTAKLIIEAVRTSDTGEAIFQRVQATRGIDIADDGSLPSSLAIIEAFSDAFDTSYYALG